MTIAGQKSGATAAMRVFFDVPITMDDGAVLRADVFLPAAEGRYPVLLAHGPYGKGLAFYDGHFEGVWKSMTTNYPETGAATSNRYQVWELVDPERWVPEGYGVVRVDSRGSGRSQGVVDMMSPREIQDFAAAIEWAGVQDWSNGKVGLSGISYYAITQWLVASRQPKHLAAMFAFEGAADQYRDMARHGGVLTTFWRLLGELQIRSVQNGLGMRGYRSRVTGELVSGPQTLSDEELAANWRDLFAEHAARELDDEWYRSRSADWSKVTVPFLSAGSWGGQGLHLRGNTEAFTEAASRTKFLEMHGLEHWTHFYTDYGFGLQKRFFDHFLKGESNGFDSSAPVRLQVRHPGNRFVEREESEWPLARTHWTDYHLSADGSTIGAEAPRTDASIAYKGFGDGVTFLSAPFAEQTEITGPLAAKLFVSSETEDADLFLVLRLFAPDLKEQVFIGSQDTMCPLTLGWLRASHRKLDPARSKPWRPFHPHDEKRPLQPGEIVECDIELWATSIVVPAGFRIGLSVRGRDYVAPGAPPRSFAEKGRPGPNGVGAMFHNDGDDRPAAIFGGKVTIHTGPDHPSRLLVPIVPAK